MIVRILGEGQYDVPDDALDRLNELDPAVVASVDEFKASRLKYERQMKAWIDAQPGEQRDFRGRPLREDLELLGLDRMILHAIGPDRLEGSVAHVKRDFRDPDTA